ncbi:acetyl-CoA carboxylase carboxyltransferase subunit alpha [Elizabethkingia meningoseptica]|uniref:Acetyl-coenzyme A carboxylase carboxyl transferase subunit alpha n=1 Tax=Elizabethkingia meningoseptica TaxID=238 RepID=A0A1V3U4B0_ELIME|nr:MULTISPECIES: acetyl-CoA carboxylase carboxyltransferase subunit alpha [Elizabethkingia]AQX06946.1 acetyl-CoA carboxylase carboxyltransferase subunit alpha [Elizabethkingia meningoseptica]AQX14189.1 acetyl-CoA carboxylase carboxyltransferase subunit alpha [Elizabethkingia meningoseptica]AQX48989.1 acetyl-CoA carboxyl transferase [Elizabethkingia meningoseptica]EJK5329087.1 acetyl-CoA carboxylase carboxyltransferase subunit alpha [Elizabethkingia meningoseptica]EOR28617.1 Acetyl-CoA carboxyl
MEYLEFEKPIEELMQQYDKCSLVGEESGIDVKLACTQIEDKIISEKKEIYGNLTPWQKVQLSRHPNRPYALDFINGVADKGSFLELHGDRNFADDPAMVGGIATIEGQSVMFIGTQKGRTTKERQYRRFGMSNPEGYRKALRLMKLAEKFNIPIVTFVDTPGAYPGLEAEERGQGEAIARNIYEMCRMTVPIITIVIGEGASGGALGIGVGNKVYMMENSWYSVISPENCSAILWRSWEYKEVAAATMKLTAPDMLKEGLIDGIIEEPLGGAHYEPEVAYQNVKSTILSNVKSLKKFNGKELMEQRQEKFINMGKFKG